MSTLKVEIVTVKEVLPHPNADRLELLVVKGWQAVAQKGVHTAGDKVIYFPIDSVLPNDVEETIFTPGSKVKLNKGRVKTIKLRGAISQGLVVGADLFNLGNEKVGADVTAKLNVTKYEPPVRRSGVGSVGKSTRKQSNPNFRKYTSIENYKNYNKLFHSEEIVVATEKIHGTNFRAGWVPNYADKWWKKILKFFGVLPKWEFVYGSHNVQLQYKPMGHTGYYDENVYLEAVRKHDLKSRMCHGEVVYGEIYGPGIQKNYHYGLKDGERGLVIFDVMVDGAYLPHIKAKSYCDRKKLKTPPILFLGAFDGEKLKELTKGESVMAPSQKVREGLVVKPINEQRSFIGRKILKMISDDYLLKDNTDFH